MDRKKLLIRLTSLIFLIFIVNYLAHQFYWYSAIWYFDMLMHFSGGFWLGLTALWFFSKTELSFRYFIKIMLTVLLVGISWELFEVIFYNLVAQNSFDTLDSLSDICFDLAGGLAAVVYFMKRIMYLPENTVQYNHEKRD
ncbi:MAG: hypothetical protein Q7K54_05870 [Candidatus Parcubacteria bacterium]|nr:hypothetical protein [Candidatus Parcubacteria bacterium]